MASIWSPMTSRPYNKNAQITINILTHWLPKTTDPGDAIERIPKKQLHHSHMQSHWGIDLGGAEEDLLRKVMVRRQDQISSIPVFALNNLMIMLFF